MSEFEIPEQERTRRARQQTWRHGIASTVVIAGAALVCANPGAAAPLLGGVAVLVVAWIVVEYRNREIAR